jgi:hypothetical protein
MNGARYAPTDFCREMSLNDRWCFVLQPQQLAELDHGQRRDRLNANQDAPALRVALLLCDSDGILENGSKHGNGQRCMLFADLTWLAGEVWDHRHGRRSLRQLPYSPEMRVRRVSFPTCRPFQLVPRGLAPTPPMPTVTIDLREEIFTSAGDALRTALPRWQH